MSRALSLICRVEFSDSKRTRRLICLTLIAVTIGVYAQVGGFDFINYDDPGYVTENNEVKAGLTPHGIAWAFTHFREANWHPLTWLSHMLDVQIFGLRAGWHHLVNVALHVANVVLLFLLLQRTTRAPWRSAVVAALFALHPLHVESVAWIAERKDVLSTFFGLLALTAYAKYVESKSAAAVPSPESIAPIRSESRKWYLWTTVCFALSLMAKPMLVTLPFAMLLLDFWPLQRMENQGWRTFFTRPFFRLMWEKKLWFAMVAASSAITFYAQKAGGAVLTTEYFPITVRIANAVHSYFEYVLKACWPIHLAIFYPLQPDQPLSSSLGATVFLVVVSLAALATIRRWPFFLVGWIWFLGTLVPVIGLVQVGRQAMADRYTYIPFTGLFIIAVWGGWELLCRRKAAAIIAAAGTAAVLIAFAVVTVTQLQYWRNSLVLFTHVLAVTRNNDAAHNNLGTQLAKLGRREEALTHYIEALRIDPNNAHYQNNLATALARQGQFDAAMEHYQAAIQINPRFAKAYSNLGALYLAERRLGEALTNLNEAIRIEPDNGEARSNLGNALSMAGRLDEAIQQHLKAVQLDPFNGTVRLNAGLALLKAGRANDAAVQFSAAVRYDPTSAEAQYELGRQLFLDHRFASALEHLGEATRLKPNYPAAQFYQSVVLGDLGRFDEAIATGQQALESAQRAGQATLAARAQEALESFKARRAYRPNNASSH
jgi:tetratricopeptide (TPR) repeat protein